MTTSLFLPKTEGRSLPQNLSEFYRQQAAEWRESAANHRQQCQRCLDKDDFLLAAFHQRQVQRTLKGSPTRTKRRPNDWRPHDH